MIPVLSDIGLRSGSGGTSQFVSLATGARTVTFKDASGTVAYVADFGTAAFLPVSTDGTLSANVDFQIPSQKAVKTYVDANAYSDEKVDDRVAVLIQAGNGLTWTYDDPGGTLTPVISSTYWAKYGPYLSDKVFPYYTNNELEDSGINYEEPTMWDEQLGTAATVDFGTYSGQVPVLGPDSMLPSSTMPIRDVFDHFSTVGNGTTVETDLYTDTVSGLQFTNNGDKLVATYGGTLVNNANTKRIRAYFSGTLIYDSLAVASTAGFWELDITIVRETAAIVRCLACLTAYNMTSPVTVAYTRITALTLEKPVILKVTGTSSGASNDVTAEVGFIRYERKA